MARITYVKKAQQRYKMVPVLDEDGQPKRTPVMRSNGQQKVTKRGKPVFMEVTVADRSQPLPNLTCGKCHAEIKVGDPYKHISPRSGPYGGRKLIRCGPCPSWQVWEYSSSLSARLAQIAHDFHEQFDDATFEDAQEVSDILSSTADEVRELANEKRESAQNIEDGFQHSTYLSDELNETADTLDGWADEIEGADIPDFPEPEEEECMECEGTGEVENEEHTQAETDFEEGMRKLRMLVREWVRAGFDSRAMRVRIEDLKAEMREAHDLWRSTDAEIPCDQCGGDGQLEPEEPTQDQIDEWRSEVEASISIVDEPPV